MTGIIFKTQTFQKALSRYFHGASEAATDLEFIHHFILYTSNPLRAKASKKPHLLHSHGSTPIYSIELLSSQRFKNSKVFLKN